MMTVFELWAAAVGQVLFVLLWAPQGWRHTWIGRALMTKSASLAFLLVALLFSYYATVSALVFRFLFWLVIIGIWYQTVALMREMWLARQADEQVLGTREGTRR